MSVRDRFILDTLKRSGDELMTRQGQAIAATIKTQTGHMLSSRSIQVSGGESSGILRIQHTAYQRYLDIKKPKKGRKRRIHNRYTYHAYSSIGERLMYGLTEEVAAQIREAAKYTTL